MRAGQLTTPVEVKRGTATRDDYGNNTYVYASQYNPLMVKVNTSPSTTVDESDGRSQRQVVTFTAAFTDDLDIRPTDTVTWGSDVFEVESSTDRLGLRQWVDISAVRLDR